MTGWSLDTIRTLTWPQVQLVLEGQGPILYPRLKPQLDAQFREISSTPGKNGEPSEIRQIINDHQARLRDEEAPLTPEQEERQRAYRIRYAYYLGEPPEQTQQAQPIEGLPPETARAVLEYAREPGFPPEIWARDVAPLLRALRATARQGS